VRAHGSSRVSSDNLTAYSFSKLCGTTERVRENPPGMSSSGRGNTAAVGFAGAALDVSAGDASHADVEHGQIDERFLVDVVAALGIPVLDADYGQVDFSEMGNVEDVAIGSAGELAFDALDQGILGALHQVRVAAILVVACLDLFREIGMGAHDAEAAGHALHEAGMARVRNILLRVATKIHVQVNLDGFAGDSQVVKLRAQKRDRRDVAVARVLHGDLGNDAIARDDVEHVQVFDDGGGESDPGAAVLLFFMAGCLGMRRAVGHDAFHAKRLGVLGFIPACVAKLGVGLALDGLLDGQLDMTFQRQCFGMISVLPAVSFGHGCSLSF